MASSRDKREEKLYTDEKILNHTSDFFSRNAVLFLILFVVVMVAVGVYVVYTHVGAKAEDYAGNWLHENFYPVIAERGFMAAAKPEDAKKLNVDEVLEKIKGTKLRPRTLYELAQYLFEKGGEESFAQADKILNLLIDEYPDLTYYQTLADALRKKIAEEREFKLPEAEAAGPKPEESQPVAPEAGKVEKPAPSAPAPSAPAPATPAPATPAPATPAPATPAPSAPVPSVNP